MRDVKAFEIAYNGIEHAQYHSGLGVCFSSFEDCALGIGYTEKEAFNDALEKLAMSGYDVEGNKALMAELEACTDYVPTILKEQDEEGELYYYIGLRVK